MEKEEKVRKATEETTGLEEEESLSVENNSVDSGESSQVSPSKIKQEGSIEGNESNCSTELS